MSLFGSQASQVPTNSTSTGGNNSHNSNGVGHTSSNNSDSSINMSDTNMSEDLASLGIIVGIEVVKVAASCMLAYYITKMIFPSVPSSSPLAETSAKVSSKSVSIALLTITSIILYLTIDSYHVMSQFIKWCVMCNVII